MDRLTNPLLLAPIGGAILGGIVALVIVFVVANGDGGAPEPTATRALAPSPSATLTPHATLTATSTPAVTITSTPTPTALPTSSVPLGELIKGARAFVTARGFYPQDPIVTDDGQGRHLMAFPSLCSWTMTSNHVNCQATHFFLEDTYLGTDTLHTYYGYEYVRLLGSGQFAIDYTTYAPEDPECCPSVEGTVTYTWTGDRLMAAGEPPLPRGQPFSGGLANEPQPLYIAIYSSEGGYRYRYEGERILLVAQTTVTINLADMSLTSDSHALEIPDLSLRSPDTTGGESASFQVTLPTPGIYDFHCPYHPEDEHGIIEVVATLGR